MYKRFTTVAGRTIINRYTDSSRIRTEKRRKPKTNKTPEAVAKINKINQERELTAKLNASFEPGDWWITLSNEYETTIADSMERMSKMKRGLQRYCKKNGIPFKIVETMGIGQRSRKVHHHLVMNKEIPLQVLYRYWQEEKVFAQPLKGYNYQRVARYILKNAEESKNRRGKYMKAFRCSRQVVKPEPRVESVKRQPTYDIEDIRPRQGYQIDRDSIRMYEHPITGAVCLEYIEVSLQPEPRIRRYYRGKPARFEPMYQACWDEQMTIEQIQGGDNLWQM